MSKKARKRSGGRSQPLVVGPDLDGHRAVVAGDRLCWFGKGPIPQTPGARHIRVATARIVPGRLEQVTITTATFEEPGREEFYANIRRLRTEGVTTLVVALSQLDEAKSVFDPLSIQDELAGRLERLRRRGFRLLIVSSLGMEKSALDLVEGLALVNRDQGTRFAILDDAPNPDPLSLESNGWIQLRSDHLVGLVEASRCFGRRLGVLEIGACADLCFQRDDSEFLRLRVVAGRVFESTES